MHAHQGEDLAVLPLAELVARLAGVPPVVTLHCSVARTLDPAAARGALRLLDPDGLVNCSQGGGAKDTWVLSAPVP